MWRNWQTRMVQVHVLAREWRFKSSHPHQQNGIGDRALRNCPPSSPRYAYPSFASLGFLQSFIRRGKVSCAGMLLRWFVCFLVFATDLGWAQSQNRADSPFVRPKSFSIWDGLRVHVK